MFEPQAFDEKPQGQDALIAALLNRDMKAFEVALADPGVNPNYWYGKPYWSTCLELAAKAEGCEAFVIALLRAGVADRRYPSRQPPRPSDASSVRVRHAASALHRLDKYIAVGGDFDEYLDLLSEMAPSPICVCGAQSAAAAAALSARAQSGEEDDEHHLHHNHLHQQQQPLLPPSPGPERTSPASPTAEVGGVLKPEHVLGLWLRDISRALRESAEYTRRELRGMSERVEQLGERVVAMERAQQRTNDILLQLKQ